MVVGETQHFRKPPKTLLGSIVGNLLLKPQIHHRFLQLFSLKFPAKKAAPEPEPVGRPWWASWVWWSLMSEKWDFLKWWYPQIIHFNRVFHYKPSILGYPCFWKHPDEWEMVLHGTRLLLLFFVGKKTTQRCLMNMVKSERHVGWWNMYVHVWKRDGDGFWVTIVSLFWVKHSSDLFLLMF